MKSADEEAIKIRIAQDRDVDAFKQLIKAYSMKLYTYAMAFVKEHEGAEEVVSDVWMSIWNLEKDMVHISHLSSYLFTSTKNKALNYRRKQKLQDDLFIEKDQNTFLLGISSAPEDIPQHKLELKELTHFIEDVIENLPSSSKSAFKLVRENGLSYQQAADELGISVNTLKTYLARAIKKLRTEISDYLTVLLTF